MVNLSISSELGEIFPNLALGIISANVKIETGSTKLWNSIDHESKKLINELSLGACPR